MIIIKRKRIDFLEFSMDNSLKKCCRFPNKMIWDINTYLSQRYKLYEYYFSKNVCDGYYVSLSKFNVVNKFLCFSDLDPSYIRLVNYDEDEYKTEYEKHKSEVNNYEQFFEYYSMEEIEELSYIATSNLPKYVCELSKKVETSLLKPKKNISIIADNCSDVAIHIADHSYMTIQSKHNDIIEDLIKIVDYNSKI